MFVSATIENRSRLNSVKILKFIFSSILLVFFVVATIVILVEVIGLRKKEDISYIHIVNCTQANSSVESSPLPPAEDNVPEFPWEKPESD